MVEQLTVTERDLRRMFDVIDRGQQAGPDEVYPRALLQALRELIPADDATFQVSRPVDREFVAYEEAHEQDVDPGEGWEDLFWRSYWEHDVCSRPQRTGDDQSVWKVSDYLSARQLARSSAGEWFRVIGMRSEITVPFPATGAEDRRLMLFRGPGPDFSERERLLLRMLRPHLIEVHRDLGRRRAGIPDLTSRQLQLLRLVAEGHSNTQIARRLFVAEGTVRKHLENIYQRLGVTSRTAAVATAFPLTRSA
ncbi:helix-turn-helix transcriptional regulator [Kribbella shirazensis]|jgi:DNA-binding CsgD family transcriptional regulator|uniref:DNA-binding CsgD family transcriptional regulator n=1 Tax=Kribbella shirazensis TaxID=1105143 RepID=A0A7X5V826_9ACTN|nr:response regulator transcription factor [Kribbella shirazensis]NIK56366.1 DNA-binding CsgD family transcriptional regulator [Kribbella shirazensis]